MGTSTQSQVYVPKYHGPVIFSACVINLAVERSYGTQGCVKALSRTGAVNFYKYGKQDGLGLSRCSNKFVDGFLFYVLAPYYFV